MLMWGTIFMCWVIISAVIRCDANVVLTANTGKCLQKGQFFMLNCSLPDDENGPLYFQKNGKRLLSEMYSTLSDGKTVGLNISTVTSSDNGMYTCCRNICQLPGDFDNGLFIVGDYPTKPLDFACIVENDIRCTFTYKDACVMWDLVFQLSGTESFRHGRCGTSSPREAYCVNRTETGTYGSLRKLCTDIRSDTIQVVCYLDDAVKDEVYYLFLNGSSPFGISSFTFTIATNITIEKIGNLMNFRVASKSARAINLKWKFPSNPGLYENGISCNLSFNNSSGQTQHRTKQWITDKSANWFVDRLVPYTKYKIQVVCRFTDSRYWSDIATTTVTTSEDVPSFGPRTSRTSYTLYRSNMTTAVAIYVKPPAKLTRNGVLKGYKVVAYCKEENKAIFSKQFDVVSTLTIDGLPSHHLKTMNVTVRSLTKIGQSLHETSLVINMAQGAFNATMLIQEVAVIVYPDDCYLISVYPLNTTKEVTYVYHWCEEETDVNNEVKDVVICSANYNFEQSNRTSMKKCNFPKPSQNITWRFGVSIRSPTVYHGIRWEDCKLPSSFSSRCSQSSPSDVIQKIPIKELGLLWLLALAILPMFFLIYKAYHYIKRKLKFEFELPRLDGPTGVSPPVFHNNSNNRSTIQKNYVKNKKQENIVSYTTKTNYKNTEVTPAPQSETIDTSSASEELKNINILDSGCERSECSSCETNQRDDNSSEMYVFGETLSYNDQTVSASSSMVHEAHTKCKPGYSVLANTSTTASTNFYRSMEFSSPVNETYTNNEQAVSASSSMVHKAHTKCKPGYSVLANTSTAASTNCYRSMEFSSPVNETYTNNNQEVSVSSSLINEAHTFSCLINEAHTNNDQEVSASHSPINEAHTKCKPGYSVLAETNSFVNHDRNREPDGI